MASEGTQFKPGQSGNPNGRPKGSRNTRPVVLEQILRAEGSELLPRCLDDAFAGDAPMRRVLLPYLLSDRPGRTLEINLPRLDSLDRMAEARAEVMRQLTAQNLALEDAQTLFGLLHRQAKALADAELETRVEALEAETQGDA